MFVDCPCLWLGSPTENGTGTRYSRSHLVGLSTTRVCGQEAPLRVELEPDTLGSWTPLLSLSSLLQLLRTCGTNPLVLSVSERLCFSLFQYSHTCVLSVSERLCFSLFQYSHTCMRVEVSIQSLFQLPACVEKKRFNRHNIRIDLHVNIYIYIFFLNIYTSCRFFFRILFLFPLFFGRYCHVHTVNTYLCKICGCVCASHFDFGQTKSSLITAVVK